MKVVILAGGYGTRISEESQTKPKPMVEIGGKPILWHILKGYSTYGYNDFIICAGYKQQMIKEYFANYYLYNSDITFDLSANSLIVHNNYSDPWRVTVVDTGLDTMTGGRVKRIRPYVGEETFMLTYGDGVSDINLKMLEKFHENHGKMVTISAYSVGQRFGILDINQKGQVTAFREKSLSDDELVNMGFMVCSTGIFNYLDSDSSILEKEPLENIAKDGQLMAYKHAGFWQCMDTLRERQKLEELWASGNAPWKTW